MKYLFALRWRTSFVAGLITSLMLFSSVSQADSSNPLLIHTQSGVIVGKNLPQTFSWQGIPYAKPPIGPLRWHAPEPAEHWSGIKQTSTFGASCMQTPPPQGPEAILHQQPMSEDCLTLNIWKPKRRFEEDRLPVMVWIHGGAFRMGASSLKLYDGANVAKKGVIVVTLNYRLGPLSVFPHPAMDKEDKGQALNFGLLDQIAALQWVKNNIGQFGGDANNITIWGESAGGASVGYLLTSPLSNGLFNKAIIESGALALPELSRQQAITDFKKQLPPSIAHMTKEQLRNLPASQLLTLPLAKTSTMPIIDGVSLTEKTLKAIASGHYHHVPLLIGSNNDEAGFFPPAWRASVKEKLGNLWPHAAKLTDGYGTNLVENKEAQLATDIFATVNTRALATSSVKNKMPTWRYYFSYQSSAQQQTHPGAIHTAEIPYVFGNIDQLGFTPSEEDKELANNLTERWVHFAKHGTPNPVAFKTWPQYNPTSDSLWVIDASGEHMMYEQGTARLDLLQNHPEIQLN